MPAPGAEGIGGGSPEWRAPTDQAPTNPGYEDDFPLVGGDIEQVAKMTARLPEAIGGFMLDMEE